MAKDNIALLNEIAGSLRKLNQSNIREQLKTQEFQKQQIAIQGGQPLAEDQGPAFVDAAEDFRRRVKGSVTGAFAAEKVTASGVRARRSNEEFENEKAAFKATVDSEKEETKAASGLSDIYNLLLDWKNMQSTAARNAGRDATENELEKSKFAPGMNPNSMATRIKKNWQLPKDKDGNVIPPPKSTKGLVTKLVIAAGVAASMSIDDVIRGWKMDGLDGAVSSYFGGAQEGGMGNAVRQSFVLGAQGAAVGFAFGGPVGALVGGIMGAATGAITGSIGAAKINTFMDKAGAELSTAWTEIKTNFGNLTDKIGAWIHTPGEGTSATGGFKSKMFGGIIEWNPTKSSGETLSSAWKSVVAKMEAAPGKFAAWLENDLRNGLGAGSGSNKLADWLFGKTDAAKKVIRNNKKFSFDDARMNPEDQPGFKARQILRDQINAKMLASPGFDAKGDYIGFVGIGSPSMNELINKAGGPNLDADGNIIGTHRLNNKSSSSIIESGGLVESLLNSARSGYLSFSAMRERNISATQGGYGDNKPIVIPVNSDSSTSSVTTTINIEKKETLGSGNNNNSIMGEDGFIYSW
jgi:hypothetical protein